MGTELRKISKTNQQSLQIPVLEKPVSEKRGDHRHTLALDAEVYFTEQDVDGMFRCRTQNIGLNGVFLPSSAIPVESELEVDVILKGKSGTSVNPGEYRIAAQVVHTSDLGAGLVFKQLDPEQLQDFRRFLFKAKVAARH